MKKNKKNQSQFLFGAKCVLLAAALILIAIQIGLPYVLGEPNSSLNMIIGSAAAVFVIIVMIFEIQPYIQLHNEGVRAVYQEKNVEVDKIVKFNRLIEHNEFIYNFQPIIDARNGSVYAYEILMRTGSDIGLDPHEILKCAEISHMLYSIERYTFFNALRIFDENRELFGDKKIFINSIPNVILSDEDLQTIREKYSNVSENVVIEILESAADNDESIEAFDQLREILGCQIAIDDYGSGYSNDSKLLNNNPNYIKIDISLIRSIDTDLKKQLLVANLIKFARQYNIKILAEGVETKEELRMLIELGVDLIQGFYTARPSGDILQNINEDIKDYIIDQNIRLSKYDNDNRVYSAKSGEVINLLELAINKITVIEIGGGDVRLVGEKNNTINMVIKTADNSDCRLTFENVNIKGAEETTVQLGVNSSAEIILKGDNVLHKEGIRVPGDSSLTIRGSGNLSIKNNRNNGVGIGGNFNQVYGNITFDAAGEISVESSGDRVVCIGGGNKGETASIRVAGGKLNVKGRGIAVVGIGSASGTACIHIAKAEIKIQNIGNEAVGIGTLNGEVNVTSTGNIDISMDGERICGIGTPDGGVGRIVFTDGVVSSIIHGALAVAIGSVDGSISIQCSAEVISVYGEGECACCIGNYRGSGQVIINSGTVIAELLSAEAAYLGGSECKAVIMGGNVILGKGADENIVNAFGEPLKMHLVDGEDLFEKHIVTEAGDYVYRAERNPMIDKLCVYIPEACEMKEMAK